MIVSCFVRVVVRPGYLYLYALIRSGQLADRLRRWDTVVTVRIYTK
jgi:hypothetical protein